MRRIMGFMTVAALGLALAAAQADTRGPNATLSLSGGSVGAGIGVEWANGTLNYEGKRYPVVVKGLTVGDVGATVIEASGKVYDLKKVGDFDGNFTAVDSGLTVAGGGKVAAMRNQNGVTVELVSTTQGVDVGFGAAGVDMKIKK